MLDGHDKGNHALLLFVRGTPYVLLYRQKERANIRLKELVCSMTSAELLRKEGAEGTAPGLEAGADAGATIRNSTYSCAKCRRSGLTGFRAVCTNKYCEGNRHAAQLPFVG